MYYYIILYFPAFELKTYLSVFSRNAAKYEPENSEYGNFSQRESRFI